MMRMRRLLLVLVGALAVAAGSAPADAGPWTSYTHPYDYRAVMLQGDTVWCATLESGLLQFHPMNGPPDSFFTYHREPGGLASNHLTSIAMERSRRLWVGTDGAGVSRLSADRSRWDLIKTFDGLPEDSITVLVAQGDSIWIGTTKGIALWNGALRRSRTTTSPGSSRAETRCGSRPWTGSTSAASRPGSRAGARTPPDCARPRSTQ